MPYPFENLLTRLDGPTLNELLPPGVSQLLKAIDDTLVYPRNLLRVLATLRSPIDLLSDKHARSMLLDQLPPDQATVLAMQLGMPEQGPSYEYLKRLTFSRKVQLADLYSFFGIGVPQEEEETAEESDSFVEPNYPLFPHQNSALRELRFRLSVEPYRALLHMPTGSGKTRTAMNVVVDHLRSKQPAVVIWLAHSEELCQQAADEFTKAWKTLGNRPLRVARFWGKYDSDLTELRDGIVIAGLSKSFSRLRSDDRHFRALSGRTPFVIIDEAHQAIAPTYRQILDLLVRPTTGAKLLGLSATPGRTWNDPDADEKLSNFFGRNKVVLKVEGYENPVKYLIDEGYLAAPIFRRIEADSTLELTQAEKDKIEETFDVPGSVLDRLGRNQARNLLIISEIEKLVRRHHRIIVFGSSVEQASLLAAVLVARGHSAASVSSRNASIERRSVIAHYLEDSEEPRILCNFGVLTTGFDAPRTSAAVIARPTLSLVLYSQMVGRAMRGVRAHGNKSAEIVTVVDPALPGFDSVESAFSNWEDVWNTKGEI